MPIVDTADDAVTAFRRLPLDFLVIGDHLLLKRESNR
jgi:predicted NodU family carbamoyl transferase